MDKRPLVSVIIPSRNRDLELERTLYILQRQTYRPLELIVVDDASDHSLESLVGRAWPGAIFVRKEVNVGQCQCRNEGFKSANGRYLLSLDDDSGFARDGDLDHAVALLESRPELGVLAFYTFHGPELPIAGIRADSRERFTQTFIAASALIRRTVIDETGGYMAVFGNEGEEEELSMRILDRGWGILFVPSVLIHHRVSQISRNTARTWERGLRNKLWSIVIHMPWRRVPVEIAWKVGVGLWDAVRLRRFRRFFRSISQFLHGLSAVLRVRKPISGLTLRRYDAIRFRGVRTAIDYANPSRCGIKDLVEWFNNSWRNRPRSRSFWDRRPGDVGSSSTSIFAHEFAESNRDGPRAV
jgi:glycosyltransferase involved in cell wall biosynthesis